MVKRAPWLSVTPEPERVLPEAVATLAAGRRVSAVEVEHERVRIERLILHGSQRQWLNYLHQAVELIHARADEPDPDVVRSRAIAVTAIGNHHNLLLAHPGRGAAITADDRVALERLRAELEPELDTVNHYQRT